jgi:V/A-type H+-transporting ATPase subunit C
LSKKIREYDYLYLSGRIHALENTLLTHERMERMLDARTVEDAAKVLTECGYGEFPALTPEAVEYSLDEARLKLFSELRSRVPDPGVIDVFRIKYDYHNAKVLLKAEARGVKPEPLFIDAGRYPAARLRDDFVKEDLRQYSKIFTEAMTQAKETLAVTGDPQSADIVMDRGYYAELLEAAEQAGSEFLTGFVRLSIDAANLRSAVRSVRMGRGVEFLRQVLISGGEIKTDALITAALGSTDLVGLFVHTPLEEAASAGAAAMEGGPLTAFERLCDNAVTAYLAQSRRVAFGEQPLIGYLYAREAELTTIRIIMTGRMAGLDTDTIRERLRDAYV